MSAEASAPTDETVIQTPSMNIMLASSVREQEITFLSRIFKKQKLMLIERFVEPNCC